MQFDVVDQEFLTGKHGPAARKAMQILMALAKIFDAEQLVPVTSVQVAGVSYDNLGEAGLEFLNAMADGGAKARVLATLNPAGMDFVNWQAMGIDDEFANHQKRVISVFARMNVITSCTCTPYLNGNLPQYGEHIAWSESSAVCYANSVLGARSNREGGPSALAAAIIGKTPAYGMHLEQNRRPTITVNVQAKPQDTHEFGALGAVIGKKIEKLAEKPIVYIRGISVANLESMKSFCASIATYGGVAMFHMEEITPEFHLFTPPAEQITITQTEIDLQIQSLNDANPDEVDFVSLGCPHLSIREIAHLAELLQGKFVKKTFWITTSRSTKLMADQMGYSKIIEDAGATFAVDTCCVVAPIRGRFHAMLTDSAKACYYASAKNRLRTSFASFDDVVRKALG
jgi:predicted aconitase